MQIRSDVSMMARLFLLPSSMATLLALPAGAADMAQEERQVSGFHAVVLKTVGELEITQGDRERLVVEAEPAVLPKIGTVVRDGVLYIEGKASPIITERPIRFSLGVRELRALEASATGAVALNGISGAALAIDAAGSSNISGSRLDVGELRVRLSGAGNVTLEGRAKRQAVRISGAGQYRAGQLASEQASVSLSGAGNAVVNAAQALEVELSGSGNVRYIGDPAIKQKVSGAGSVQPASQ